MAWATNTPGCSMTFQKDLVLLAEAAALEVSVVLVAVVLAAAVPVEAGRMNTHIKNASLKSIQ